MVDTGSRQFYFRLPVFTEFSAVSDLKNYTSLPGDWYILAADVQDSTAAIRAGQYKGVNITGVSVITSVKNLAKSLPLPYIFGGDGATLCIPPELLDESKQALLATQEMAGTQFQLHLRVGVVPVGVVREKGLDVLVLRHQISEHYIQAAFTGGGIEYAEGLIKQENEGRPYRLEPAAREVSADYTGLECRWDNVPSEHGEVIALMVKALAPSIEQEAVIYNEVIEKVKQIYGDDDHCRPVYERGLKLTHDPEKLSYEVRLRTFGREKMAAFKYWLSLRVQLAIGRACMYFGLKTGEVEWSRYKSDVISNTDFKKFDGMLREVLSGTEQQRAELEDYLRMRFEQGDCVYGIHVSDSALVTCMINNRHGEHFHFVDGANGGYAMAAAVMKAQLEQKAAY